MKSTTTRLISLVGIAMLAAHWAQAANSTWNGGTANWGVAGNWNGGLTSATQAALFNSVFANQPNLSGTSSTAQGIWLATGFTRHYAVETSISLTSWAAVSGYSDVVGANNTITITLPVSGTKNFYRLKAWLQ